MDDLCEDVIGVILEFSVFETLNTFCQISRFYRDVTLLYVSRLPIKAKTKCFEYAVFEGGSLFEFFLADKDFGPNHKYFVRIFSECSVRLASSLLGWRGSDPAWHDPRDPPPDMMSDWYIDNVKITEILLAWRGPNGEWYDPRKKIFWNFGLQAYIDIAKLLLEWRGPDGEVYSPLQFAYFGQGRRYLSHAEHMKIIQMSLDHMADVGMTEDITILGTIELSMCISFAYIPGMLDIVKYILNWRGSKGEWVDVRFHEFDDNLIQEAAGWGTVGSKKILKLLQDWRGPNGESLQGGGVDESYSFCRLTRSASPHHPCRDREPDSNIPFLIPKSLALLRS